MEAIWVILKKSKSKYSSSWMHIYWQHKGAPKEELNNGTIGNESEIFSSGGTGPLLGLEELLTAEVCSHSSSHVIKYQNHLDPDLWIPFILKSIKAVTMISLASWNTIGEWLQYNIPLDNGKFCLQHYPQKPNRPKSWQAMECVLDIQTAQE